ncbi:hypothetical protein CgunFtcFv8_012524 [Champsocephalus gunnari]|uniref:Non-muscle caldesmon n=1 Tax=Champsocephalus gunnari TaxID=52237 RepID=A0AAN8DXL9_CHAGU|nr:hypothetical protein CgunFtcFv8_012524 [Champsocephalus gunnari]
MSNALLRRNSSKQGLKNLMKLTAQRSVEDAEELERERRRRARESYCWTDGGSMPGETSPEDGMPAEESMYDGALKPNSSPSLEEDEGFSDWTQRRERRRQQRLQELSQGGEEEEEEENRKNKSAAVKSVQTSVASSSRLQRQEHHHEDDDEEERVEMERRKKQEEEAFLRAERMRREEEEEKRKKEEVTIRRKAEVQKPKAVEKRKEVKISYTSKVFLNQEAKQSNGDATKEEVTTIKNQKAKRSTSSRSGEEVAADRELTELKMKREERRRVREEEERRREEEERQKLAHEEEERRMTKEDTERRVEASERMKSRSSSSVDGDEMFSPFSPKAPKITERTESLSRSLKKSNSFKKTQPFGLLIKIDDKREQYAHAVENSQEARAVKASLSDLPGSPEVVSSKKNLFEAGETWSPSRGASCKDTEGLKVGVANRITQWVKGPTDGSRTSLKPADVRPGEVMQKKNMWEIIGDSTGRPGQSAKGSAAGKKYKFVVTGHGKYEKIPVDEDGEEFADGEDGETRTCESENDINALWGSMCKGNSPS